MCFPTPETARLLKIPAQKNNFITVLLPVSQADVLTGAEYSLTKVTLIVPAFTTRQILGLFIHCKKPRHIATTNKSLTSGGS